MPFIEINGAQIYYQTYGPGPQAGQPAKTPIVLIHGSTSTGAEDWGLVAPLLARDYPVIVPDCRGHGQSTNPDLSYSFKELADDVAALIHALGYDRAHVIGHSNGGNVALVTLLEHPDVVQTAIPQAANAYVSQDLVEREPRLFDPERVQRESPAWMNNMIRLHGPAHGPDYWRDLLRLTVQAIISEPNYTPADLAKVERPTLVIQGAEDAVNAPAQHAQFIASHIPYAEAWIPAGIQHNVHDEALLEWVPRVLDFLARRGSDAAEALYRLKTDRYADDRTAVFDVRVHAAPGSLRLTGNVLGETQRQDALQAVRSVQPNAEIQDELRVLITPDTPWALVRRGVTDLRRGPSTLSERLSQALLGEAVRILEDQGEWAWVRLEGDNYPGWIQQKALHPCSEAEVLAYRAACNACIQAEMAPVRDTPPGSADVSDGKLPGKLPFGVPVIVTGQTETHVEIRLPDDRRAWLQAQDVLPDSQRPARDADGIQAALTLMRRFAGVPYLWGGRTPFGFDCSGFAQAFHAFLGVRIRRDADQQFQDGTSVEGTPLPGDLFYFGERAGRGLQRFGAVTHVAISLGGWDCIHANGTAWGVSLNSLEPDSPRYNAWLHEHLLGVKRFL